MAANLKTIQIPAEVKLEIKNQAQTLGKLVKEMQDIFANADPGSSFGKSLQRGIVQAEKKLNSANGLLGKEFFSEADLAKTLKQMDGISDILSEIHVLAKGASTKALGFETQELIDSTKALKDFKAQVQDLKKNTKMGAINGMVDKDSVKQMAAMSKTTGFSMGKTFDENYTSLSKSLDTVSKDYLELQLEAQKAKEAMEAANLAAAKAKVDLNMAQGKLDSRKQANVNAAQAVAGISTGVGGASHRTKQNVIDDYKKLLDQQLVNGQWASGGEDFARIIAGWLEVDEGDLTGTATQIVTNLKRSIETAMKKGPISANVLNQNAQNILNGDASALQKDAAYRQTQNEVATATTAVKTTENAAKNALTTLQAANNNINQTATLLNTIRTQMAELKQLQAEYNALVDKNNSGRMDQLRQSQADAEKRARAGVEVQGRNAKTAGNTTKAGYDLQGQVQQGRIMEEQQKRLEEQGRRESEQFVNNLKQATNRWMSMQQVVNLVKRGVRQAYQDIKALDTAMTNIAVVTDMSIQELWGKIDQYMSIAQQYGVTTQGVYEVSQLYYQQGLSTNEVMAATTETLKLARIAGMDYKDAADAMTVAIRSFKMEMDDAQRVTDVYSKVAAITASDSEELAVAMSKTASSAESVGSSFENTTAMLAVMVETTRESAQNLGSALKSIISRYGEMKAGKTTDEDGEAIYYNKVDQALASVGISLKDAQGQFRDFDDVIFELSKKWDSLDKNTQRYIATIMAGNRQQSRFIALVDNWERLDEVSQAAADSADAGLLQYAKTLDSLDTKLNQLKNNFQTLYMSIFNGEFFKGFINILNNIVSSTSKIGIILGGINLLQLISQIKLIGHLLINSFSKGLGQIGKSRKEWQNQFTGGWETVGDKIAQSIGTALTKKGVIIGRNFVKSVEQGTSGQQLNQNALQPQTTTVPQYSKQIWQQATQQMAQWSPLKGQFQQSGAINIQSSYSLAGKDMLSAYNEAANNILKAGDKYDEVAKTWAQKVIYAGDKFNKFVQDGSKTFTRSQYQAAKDEYSKEISGAELEAQIELAAAKAAAEQAKQAQQRANVSQGLMMAGTALTSAGMMMDQSTMGKYHASTGLQTAGGIASVAGYAVTKNYVGAAITAITTLTTVIARFTKVAEVELENAKKASEEANVERAKTKESYTNLQSLLKQYETAKANQYTDEESRQTWLDINNQLVEAYPELLDYIDAEGNAIANVTSKTELLSYYMQKAAEASKDYYDAKIYEIELQLQNNKDKMTGYNLWGASAKDISSSSAKPLDELGIAPSSTRTKNTSSPGGVSTTFYSYTVEDIVTGLERNQIDLNKLLVEYNLDYEKYQPYFEKGDPYNAVNRTLHSVLESLGVFVKSGDQYVLSDSIKEYYDAYHQQNQLIGFKKGAASSALGILLSGETRDDAFNSISGYESLLYTYAISLDGITDDILKNLHNDSEEWQKIINGYTALYSSFSESQQDVVSALYENLDQYSLNEVESILSNKLNLGSDNKLYQAFITQWYEKNYTQLQGWIERYGGLTGVDYTSNITASETSAFSKGLDIENWIKRKAEINSSDPELAKRYTLDNISNLYQEYYQELEGAINSNDPFFDFIKQNYDSTINAYLEYLSNDSKLIANRGDGFNIAENRKAWMTQIIADSTNASTQLGSILAANDTARQEFWTTLFTDTSTYAWADNLANWGDKYDYTGFSNAEQYAYENYTIRLQTIIDSTAAAVDSLEELANKQSSNFTWEESQKYLKQIQRLDPAQTWHNLFSVNEQGLITLKDFAQTADLLYLSSVQALQKEANDATSVLDRLKTNSKTNSRAGWLLNAAMDTETVLNLLNETLGFEGEARLTSADFTESAWIDLQSKLSSGAIDSTISLIDWYNNLPEDQRFSYVVLQTEKERILQQIKDAFSSGGLTENSDDSYNAAVDLARNINNAYGLNFVETGEQFTTLVSQIRTGQITSVETLLSFYEDLAETANSANDVFSKQARTLLANTSFTDWGKTFSKGSKVKTLASLTEGSYEDLQSLWVEQIDSQWQLIMGDNLPRYEIGDQIQRNGVIKTLDLNDRDLLGEVKELADWDSADYNAYYTEQAKALEIHGASLDAFGNLIIKNWKAWADYIATSQGLDKEDEEYKQIFEEAKLQGKIALESYASSLEDGITGIATGLISNGEIEYSQLQDIIGTLQSRGALEAEDYESLMNAYEGLKNGTADSYTDFLGKITELAREAGLKGFDTSEISAAIRDAYAELISSLASALKDGVEGTLSNEDYTNLAKRYKLSGDLRTSKGVSLSAQSQQTMAVEMYRTAQASGSTLGVGEDIWAAFKDAEGSILSNYEDIKEEIAEVEKRLEDTSDIEDEAREHAEDYLKVLKQIKSAARLDPDNSIFAFMEQDWGGAGADTFDSLASSIDKVKSSLQGLKEGEYIDYKDFANMMKFLNDSGQWKTFAENTNFAGKSYSEFVRTVIENTDEFGKVNLEGIALQMGVGIDTAMESMTSSMTEGLKEVAQQQINYLKGLESFLKVAAAMEELGSIDLGIEFDIDGDLEKETIQLDQVFDIAGTFQEGSLEINEFKAEVKKQLEEKLAADEFKDVFEKIGLDQNELLKYLFPEGEVNLERIDLFGTVIKKLKEQGLSTEQWDSLALDWSSILGSGEFSYEEFFDYIMGTDPSKIVPIMNSKLQGMLAGQNISITAEGATFKYSDEGGFEVEGLTDENKAALIAEIEKAYKIDIGDIVISETGAVKIVPPEATAEAETLVTEFQTIEDAAVAVETAFTSLQEILNGFAVSDAFREFVSLVEKLKGGGASTVIGGEGDGVADGMGLNLQLDFSDALNAIDSFKSTFDNLKTTIESTPIAIQASSPSTINVTAPQNTAAQTSTVNQVTNVTQTITVTYVEANEKPEVVTPQEIEYHWKATNSIVQPSAKTVRFNWVANNPLAQWHTASNPVPVYFKWQQTGTFPNKPGDTPVEKWTGTMNNISGAAYADGSIGRMHSGAELANKALVGELGPELAVYDGQYHMLGANGAEFVKLPSDAIVFNHKQTEGILKGQFNIRGQALAEGNVSGPAYAGGAAGALALVQDAISLWQGLLNDLQLGDLLGMTGGGGGGGGSGESIAAVTEELQEWYNLSRQIADIEGKINNLIAERQNLTGGDALKNLRQQQALLQKQAQTQKILLEYQRLQLERQKEHILNNSIWSKFLTFDESGNLQYIEGNETNGGKGALQVLDELNKMSGAEQIAYLQSIGYSYTDNDGKQLTGQDLVAKFFEELQSQISNYDGLYGIVQEAEGALADIENQIAEIEQTIIDNQIELENTIYDTLVEAIEREIEELEEQKDLIEEANKNYIDGLKNALSDEQKMYSSNENIGDRESLQRRLALLRRSGGSASEIYELEKQLDDMLKSEYFDKQQELIENISDANDEQVRRLEEQIKLQKESLEFQKEHGLLWAQVYDILSGSTEEILAFLQGNNSAFIESSLVQQQQMLLEWADQVGIYKEDQKYKQYKDFAEDNLWDTGVAISKLNSSAQSDYNSLKQDQKDSVKNLFLAAYANARLEGKEHAEALSIAMADMIANINKLKTQNNASNNTPPTTTPSNNGGGGSSGGSSGGGSSSGSSSGGSSSGSNQELIHWRFKYNNQTYKHYKSQQSAIDKMQALGRDYLKKNPGSMAKVREMYDAALESLKSGPHSKGYSKGGLVDYTGLAMVHGTPGKPEAFLNAQQTKAIVQALRDHNSGTKNNENLADALYAMQSAIDSWQEVRNAAEENQIRADWAAEIALKDNRDTLALLRDSINSIVNKNTNTSSIGNFTVAPGAITINVAELSDSYDVEELSKDIMNRMVTIASKATNRGVNRR